MAESTEPVVDNIKIPKQMEITSSTSPYYLLTQFKPYNPDLLFRQKGNYDIYDDMREDDQIKSILMTKKYLMLGNGYTINLKDEKDPAQIEAKEFIEKCLNEWIEIDFNKSLLEILSSMDYGVSFSEVVWQLVDGKYRIKFIKTRAPHPFLIHQDHQGNITKLEQRVNIKGSIMIEDLTNIILFPYQMEFDNVYGKSDLRSAFEPWQVKKFIKKAWSIYLDRFGMPLALGTFDSATATQEDQNKLQAALDALQTKTSMTVPKDLEIKFLEATRAGEAGYEAALNNYNQQIARSMLMPDLLGLAGEKTGGGSYSLGQTQYDMFLKTLEWTRLELQRHIQRKIIDPLTRYNFPIEDIPQFTFKPISETVKVESLKTWIELQKTGKYKPSPEEINWARRILGAPEGDVDQPDPPPAFGIPPKLGPDGKPLGDLEDKKQPDSKKITEKPDKQENVHRETIMSMGRLRAPIMAEKKQDFAKVNEDQLNTIETYSRQASATIASMQEALLETITKGRWIENKKLDKVADLELKYSDRLRMDIKTGMREMFNLGQKDAKFELKKEVKFAMDEEDIYDQVITNAPVLASTSIVDDLTKKVKVALNAGITQGLATSQIIKQIKQIFEPYNYSIDGALLETTIRTNFLTAYTQSKLAYFAPAVKSGDIFAYQYSAIMDDRTTELCASLNGKIFRADNISDIECPLHFNCRSTLIPILKDEIEEGKIFGASEAENSQFFNESGKFIESNKDLDGYELRPGGFWVKK